MGSNNFGHWFVNFVIITNGQAQGYTIDSLGTDYGTKKATVRNLIMNSFSIPRRRNWHNISTVLQTEYECGPRSIWTMMMLLCLAFKRQIPLDLIIQRLSSLGGLSQDASAQQIRIDVMNILTSNSCTPLFHRVFPTPSTL